MKIKTKFFLVFTLLFLAFSWLTWFYSNSVIERLNAQWAQKLIERQLIFDKYRTLLPILREVSLAKQMAAEPDLLAMALNDQDPVARKKGLAVLESYRLKYQDRNYFAAFPRSLNYYYNDYAGSRTDNPHAYVLDPNKHEDRWFFKALTLDRPYQINVNPDVNLGVTKVWIDFLIRHQGEVVATVGTGLDLEAFLKQSVDIGQEGIRNIFVNYNLGIELYRDPNLITYSSFTEAVGDQKSLALLIDTNEDFQRIKTVTRQMIENPEQRLSSTMWIQFEGEKRLIGIAYLPELDWFSLTIFDTNQLMVFDPYYVFAGLIGFLLLTLVVFSLANKYLFLNPISRLTHQMTKVKQGDYEIDLQVQGHDEIAELSRDLKSMLEVVKGHNAILEKKVEERTLTLQRNEKKLNTILDHVQAKIYIKDTQYRYVYANKALLDDLGLTLEQITGCQDQDFYSPETIDYHYQHDRIVIEEGREAQREEVTYCDNQQIKQVQLVNKVPLKREDGQVYALCAIAYDITRQKRAELEIRHLAYYDTLTGLPNRRLLNDRLNFVQAHSLRTHCYAALLFVDLDGFKPLNDKYGHETGDQLLKMVAERLQTLSSRVDTVARFGGDEFILLVSELSQSLGESIEIMEEMIQGWVETMAQPYVIAHPVTQKPTQVTCTVSIGVTLFLGGIHKHDQIIRQADTAMYEAKQLGRNQYSIAGVLN